MKVEIDLKDILQDDDYGSETLQESIRRQVVDSIKQTFVAGIAKKINDEVDQAIETEIKAALKERIPNLIDNIMDIRYTPISSYGVVAQETSLRETIHAALVKQLTYQERCSSYDKNAFSKAVDETVSAFVRPFQKEFNKVVDEMLVKEYFQIAEMKIKEKLGMKQ